jgi:DNA-binding MarR family transcriptional regulator
MAAPVRRVRIHLTPRARELEPVLKSTIARLNDQALRGLSTDERACVMGALGGIIENSEAMLDR